MTALLHTLQAVPSPTWLRWLLTLELLGLAAAPLAARLFPSFPDRGYGFAKPLALLLLAYADFVLGTAAHRANQPAILWLVLPLLALPLLRRPERDRHPAPQRRALYRRICLQELLFLAAYLLASCLRATMPDAFSAEAPQDYMLLHDISLQHSFPPPDLWYSGSALNYYWLGYLPFAALAHMANAPIPIAYNLAGITICAVALVAAASAAAALTREHRWSLAAPFLLLAGNPAAVLQTLQHGLSLHHFAYWCPTRVIDGGCTAAASITEPPAFTFLCNSLHPHELALPPQLLACALAIQFIRGPAAPRTAVHRTRYLLAALTLGTLFAANTWNYPLTLALLALALLPPQRRTLTILLKTAAPLAALAVLLYAPLLPILSGHTSPAPSLTITPLSDQLDATGTLLLPALALLGLAFYPAARRLAAQPDTLPSWLAPTVAALNRNHAWPYAACACALLLISPLGWPATAAIAIVVAYRLLRDPRADHAAPLLILIALLALTLPDLGYLRDQYANRGNTVFKLYAQAWPLLALSGPSALLALRDALLPLFSRAPRLRTAAALLLAVAAIALASYPVQTIGTISHDRAGQPGLDAAAWIAARNPDEATAIAWLRAHTNAADILLEGVIAPTGTPYWEQQAPGLYPNLLSAFTPCQTVLGWTVNHETLYRGDYATRALLQRSLQPLYAREHDIDALYTATTPAPITAAIARYHITYVVLGPFERARYRITAASPLPALLDRVLHTALRLPRLTIYQVPTPPHRPTPPPARPRHGSPSPSP